MLQRALLAIVFAVAGTALARRAGEKDVMACQARTVAYEVVRVPRAQLEGVRVVRAVATP